MDLGLSISGRFSARSFDAATGAELDSIHAGNLTVAYGISAVAMLLCPQQFYFDSDRTTLVGNEYKRHSNALVDRSIDVLGLGVRDNPQPPLAGDTQLSSLAHYETVGPGGIRLLPYPDAESDEFRGRNLPSRTDQTSVRGVRHEVSVGASEGNNSDGTPRTYNEAGLFIWTGAGTFDPATSDLSDLRMFARVTFPGLEKTPIRTLELAWETVVSPRG